MHRAVGRNLHRPILYHNMTHPSCFALAGVSLHFTCNYLPLSAKQMTKDNYPIILFSSKLMCTQQERGSLMQVKIEVSPEHTPPRAVIYTDRITPEIQRALDILQAKDTPVLAERDGRTFLLSEQEVYMIRVVGGETMLYTKKEAFRTRACMKYWIRWAAASCRYPNPASSTFLMYKAWKPVSGEVCS